MKLTAKQKMFVAEYLVDLNATQAAIRAGYSAKTAEQQGSRLLINVKVQKFIQEAKQKREKRIEVNQDMVLEPLIRILKDDICNYLSFGRREVQVMGAFGPVYEKKGDGDNGAPVPVTKIVNYVDFKESKDIDTSLISEVRQGKDGVSIKLPDRMKAIELLGRHLAMFVDRQELTGKDGGPIELAAARELIAGRLNSIAAKLREGGNIKEPDGSTSGGDPV